MSLKNGVFKTNLLKESVAPNDKIIWVHQEPQLGTGHALQVAFQKIKDNHDSGEITVCNGDAPFVRETTMEKMFGINGCSLLACFVNNPHGYGRILRTPENQGFSQIIEEKDATDEQVKNSKVFYLLSLKNLVFKTEQRKIQYINAGIYCFSFDSLAQHLHTLDNNAQTIMHKFI